MQAALPFFIADGAQSQGQQFLCLPYGINIAGTHFVKVALNEVPLFIRKDACIPVADPAQTVADIDPATIRMIGWPGASYDRYDDDGVTIPAE